MAFVPQGGPFLQLSPIVTGMGINDLLVAVARRWAYTRRVRGRDPALSLLAAIWTAILYLAAFLLGAILSAEVGEAQEPGIGALVVTRVDQPITLDGLSDEPAWRHVPPLKMIMFQPSWGGPPSETTGVLVAYDDDNLYIAGRLYDREPDRIQGTTMERDANDASSDWFGVVIDTFNDKQNALSFFTTPTGLRWDAAVQNDHEGPGRRNAEWNSFWDVATVRTDEGWFAELRIPFSTLRFQPGPDGRVVMGLIVRRSIARKEEWDVYPKVPPTWGFSGLFKPSQSREIELRDIGSPRRLYLAPYTLAGMRWMESETVKTSGMSGEEHQVGLDLKYLVSSNVTLDLTVNPDFAQVEADDVRLNLTRFPLFYPEKRPFFQERAGTFELNFSSGDRVFHSRRIGIEDGRTVRILGGVRVVGRSGPWDFGLLDVQTESSGSRGGDNAGVFRVRRRVMNENSSIGAIVTSRTGRDGGSGFVLGLDGSFRVAADDYLTFRWAQSATDDDKETGFALDRMRVQALWERRTIEGVGYLLKLDHAGSEYRPELGVQGRHGATWVFGELRYGRLHPVPSALYRDSVELYGYAVRRQADGALESARIAPVWVVETKSGWGARISPRHSQEDLTDSFELAPGVVVPAGTYRYTWLKSELWTPSGSSYSGSLALQFGEFYDGSFASIGIGSTLRPASSLDLSGSVELTRAKFPSGRSHLDSRIFRIRALYMFSTRLSAAVLAQYSAADEVVSFNARMRYNPREGVDVWLVYDEVEFGNITDSPSSPSSVGGRSVMLKFSYTFFG